MLTGSGASVGGVLVNVLVGLVGAGVPVGASDPNWFYSTLAQSTAALVGLAGGFMVSRILQQRTEIANDRSVAKGEFESLWGQIAESRILAADVSQRARGVIVEVEPMLSSDHNAVSLDATRICSFSHPGNWGGSPGMEVTLEDRDLQALKELVRAAEEFETVLPGRNDLSRRLRRGQSWPRPPGAEWLRGLAQAPVDNNFREALRSSATTSETAGKSGRSSTTGSANDSRGSGPALRLARSTDSSPC